MKLLLTVIFLLISNYIFASDISIIELHTQKSLDQLVLENNTKEEESDEDNLKNLINAEDNSDETENQNSTNEEEEDLINLS